MVGVLILIDEDVTKAATVVLGHIREELKQRHCRADEIVEVEGVCPAEPALVLRIRLRKDPIRGGLSPTSEGFLVDEFVLQVRDPRREAARRVALGVEIEILDDHRHQPLRVGGVVDREVGRDAEPSRLSAQNAHASGVEGHDPHGPRGRTDEGCDTLLHLAGGLVGEGDREDLRGPHTLIANEVCDALGEDACLARTGSRNDE